MRRLDPHQVVRNVGKRVAELRRARGQTQEELASDLRISAKYVQKIELGATNMTLHTLVRWANWLGVDPSEFFKAATQESRHGRPRRPAP